MEGTYGPCSGASKLARPPGKATSHLDGSADPAVGAFRPPDVSGAWRDGAGRRRLLAVALGHAGRVARGRGARAQLVWRQPRRHARPRAPRRAASIRLLRRSPARHRRHDAAARRSCLFQLHESGDCAVGAGRVSARRRRGVPGDDDERRVQDVVVWRRPNRAADSDGDRNDRAARRSARVARAAWEDALVRFRRRCRDCGAWHCAVGISVDKHQGPGDAGTTTAVREPRV